MSSSGALDKNIYALEGTRNTKEFIEAVFDSVADGICVIDVNDFTIISANRAFLNTLGRQQEDVIGRPCFEVTHLLSAPCSGSSDSCSCPLLETVKFGTVVRADHVHYGQDGQKVFVEITTSPLRDENGEISNVVHTSHDVTESKLNEERTQRHLRRLSALRSIEVLINSTLDLRISLNVLVEQTLAQLQVDAATVLLYRPESQRLEFASGRGFRTNLLQNASIRLGEGHAGQAALQRSVVSVPDLQSHPGSSEIAGLVDGESFVGYYAAPLIAKGQIKGVLEIFHRHELSPDLEWLSFLEMLAGAAAIAIDNATLYEEAQQSNLDLSVAYDTTLEGWVRALDLRDKETEGHTQRVTQMVVRLCRRFGLTPSELVHVRRGALLHDIGKIAIPDQILLKPGPLSPEERELMQRHPAYAHEFISPISFLRPAIDIPYCHHERWDGKGYPRKLRGGDIPLAARIFAVVDVWDALRSDRPYRPAWPEEKVRKHLRAGAGRHFDPAVVDRFVELLAEETAPAVESVPLPLRALPVRQEL